MEETQNDLSLIDFLGELVTPESIRNNIPIFIAAIIAAVLFLVSINYAKDIEKYYNKAKKDKEEDGIKKSYYYRLDNCYTFFISIISIFPLLGMLGTVASLILVGKDFSNNMTDMTEFQDIMPKFFLALTSTAWGIICSVFFKLLNSFKQAYIENQIKNAKDYLDL